jgi:hypothetical protein
MGAGEEKELLTGIQEKYTMPANSEGDEVEKLMTHEFIKNLAEVSIAVASRGAGEGHDNE